MRRRDCVRLLLAEAAGWVGLVIVCAGVSSAVGILALWIGSLL